MRNPYIILESRVKQLETYVFWLRLWMGIAMGILVGGAVVAVSTTGHVASGYRAQVQRRWRGYRQRVAG